MYKRNRSRKGMLSLVTKISFLLLVILIAGCTKTPTPTPSTQAQPTASEISAPTAVEEIASTESIAEVQTEEAADENCIACHMDKDQLINTADPVEEKESESSGEG